MTYTSLSYIIFVGICLIAYYLFPKKYRWCVLLAASFGFYAIVCLKYISFIILTALSTYLGGRLLYSYIKKTDLYIKSQKGKWSKDERNAFKDKVTRNKKLITASILVLNFGILAFLKYYNFFADTANFLLKNFGLEVPKLGLFLPLGISFYTFQSMGYIIDIYRKKYAAEKNIAKFALFVSFFPQIIQGPISFYSQLSSQLYEGHKLEFENIKQGVLLITWGFFKKLIIADRLASVVIDVPHNFSKYSGTMILLSALIYSIQLYTDFSGGIDISRGVAQLFGIDLAENFKRPYASKNISEYWHRWHITLGAWLREYLFYPIAMSKAFQKFGKNLKKHFGMKVSKVLPVSVASLITFIVIGVWHGANWKYVAFGTWNGGVIMISSFLESNFVSWKKRLHITDSNKVFILFQVIRTYIIVLIGYYFDIAKNFSDAMKMMYLSVADFHITQLFTNKTLKIIGINIYELLMLIVAIGVVFIVSKMQEHNTKTLRERICSRSFVIESLVFILLFYSVVIFGVYGPGTSPTEFYYMQF